MGYDFQKITTLINDSGTSKKTFFAQIGMSEKTLSSWMNGSAIPKESSVRKIADRLGVSLSDLRTRSEDDVIAADVTNDKEPEPNAYMPNKSIKTKSMHEETLGFSDEELEEYHQYSAFIIFDTCSIMNFPDLLDSVYEGELVVVPKDVNKELEHHKTAHYYDDRATKAQKSISSIFNYKRRYPLIYGDARLELIPNVYRAADGERESTDNKILSVAIRFHRYTSRPVIFITDDLSLSNKADGEGIEIWTAYDFTSLERIPYDAPVAEDSVIEIRDYSVLLKQAEADGDNNKAVAYSIILKKLSSVKRNITGQIDAPIRDLGELYISLRNKKDIPRLKKLAVAELKSTLTDYFSEEELEMLSLSFAAAYHDALSSLGGSIKQIAGDLD